MINEARQSLAYLLRLWPVRDGEERVWRASLESAQSRERQGFADLAELLAFLEAQIERVEERPVADRR